MYSIIYLCAYIQTRGLALPISRVLIAQSAIGFVLKKFFEENVLHDIYYTVKCYQD